MSDTKLRAHLLMNTVSVFRHGILPTESLACPKISIFFYNKVMRYRKKWKKNNLQNVI